MSDRKPAYVRRFTFRLRGVLCIFVTESCSYWSQTQRPDSFIALWDYELAEMQAYRHGYPTLDPQDCPRANAWPRKGSVAWGAPGAGADMYFSQNMLGPFDVGCEISSGDTQTRSSWTGNRALTLLNCARFWIKKKKKSSSANKIFTWNQKNFYLFIYLSFAVGRRPANSHMQLKVRSFVLLIKDF